jgi:hypothetical protein
MGRSRVWVQVEGERQVRADRIHEVAAGGPGRLELQVAGHREPVGVDLVEGAGSGQVGGWVRELQSLIAVHAERRGETLLRFEPGGAGYLPHWSVTDCRTRLRLDRPPADRALLKALDPYDPAHDDRILQVTERFRRESQVRLQELPPGA